MTLKRLSLVSTSIVVGLLACAPAIAQQIVYPSTKDPAGIMVMGQGVAKVSADSAEIEFSITGVNPEAELGEEAEPKDEKTAEPKDEKAAEPKDEKNHRKKDKPEVPDAEEAPPKKSPPMRVTEASLKPIVDALVNAGVPASAVRVTIEGSMLPVPKLDERTTGTVLVTLTKPSRQRVNQLVDLVKTKGEKMKLYAEKVLVQYRVNDCAALDVAAYAAAVKDAQRRATAIATATGATLASQPAIADAFYTNYYPSACGEQLSDLLTPHAPELYDFGLGRAHYNPKTEAIVQVRKDLFVTYKLK